MPSLDPVLWTKGTLLTPQHLQAQDRYLDELLRVAARRADVLPVGASRASRSTARRSRAARSWCARSRAASPTGCSSTRRAPTRRRRRARSTPHGSRTSARLLVSLAVPEYRPGARNIAGRDAPRRAARPRSRAGAPRSRSTRDETTGLAERPIQVARPNLRLLLEGESAEGYVDDADRAAAARRRAAR